MDIVEKGEKEEGLKGLEDLKKKLDEKKGGALGRMTHFARKLLDYNNTGQSCMATWREYALLLEEELKLVKGEEELKSSQFHN